MQCANCNRELYLNYPMQEFAHLHNGSVMCDLNNPESQRVRVLRMATPIRQWRIELLLTEDNLPDEPEDVIKWWISNGASILGRIHVVQLKPWERREGDEI